MPVFDQETFEYLLPIAYQWAKKQEEFVLAHGHPAGTTHAWDAQLAGSRMWGESECSLSIGSRLPRTRDWPRSPVAFASLRMKRAAWALVMR